MQADGLVTIKHDNLKSYFKHMAKPHKYSQRSIALTIRGRIICQYPLQTPNCDHSATINRSLPSALT